MLPRDSKEPASLGVKFSTYTFGAHRAIVNIHIEDGKEMNLDLSNMRITQVVEEVDRHSRSLARKDELAGN